MLSPLADAPANARHLVPGVEPDKPKPSPYDPPSDLEPHTIDVRTHELFVKDNVKFRREIAWDTSVPQTPKIVSNWLMVETGDGADHVHLRSWPGDKLQLNINGKSYLIDVKEKEGPEQGLWIDVKGGNDTVIVDDDVKIRINVDGGDGNDCIQAGGGRSRLYGEGGDDTLRLGSGLGYAEGNDGDDTIIGGRGNAVMYGNKGDDRLYAGAGATTKQSYLDGGDGKDMLYAGNGHNVLHGGNDDDHLVGHDRTTFYTGKGRDHVWNNLRQDRIYAGADDCFDLTQGSAFTEVKPSNAGQQGFTVHGTEGFRQRVGDDLEFLRSSPVGQQVLGKMDELAVENGGEVNIAETSFGSQYIFYSNELDNLTPEAVENADKSSPLFGRINNGVAGSRADLGTVTFNRAAIIENADRSNTSAPVTVLFHEMLHAFNGATGTMLTGATTEHPSPGKSKNINNLELQVVGLPNDAEPFDFDNNPSTPPSTTNPYPFTENALNEEMGKPLRRNYSVKPSAQGTGI